MCGMVRSDRHSPHPATRTRTWPGPGDGCSTSTVRGGVAHSVIRYASTLPRVELVITARQGDIDPKLERVLSSRGADEAVRGRDPRGREDHHHGPARAGRPGPR